MRKPRPRDAALIRRKTNLLDPNRSIRMTSFRRLLSIASSWISTPSKTLKELSVKILPELSDVVDSFLKHCSVGLKIRAIMKKNLRNQVEGVVRDSFDQAVKEVVNDLPSFDVFSLSLSKAKMEMPRMDASIQALQFHEVIEEMKMIVPAWKIERAKECQKCHDTWNKPCHHGLHRHTSPRVRHPIREMKQAHMTKIKTSTIKTKPKFYTVVEDSESEEMIDLLGSPTLTKYERE